MNNALHDYLFRHREIPDIRLHDMDLSREIHRLERFAREFDPTTRATYEDYLETIQGIAEEIRTDQSDMPFDLALSNNVSATALSVKGLRRRELSPHALYELEKMTEFGLRCGRRFKNDCTVAPVTAHGTHIGALAYLSNLADLESQELCGLALQEGFRVAVSQP